jgi:hypothetical protein
MRIPPDVRADVLRYTSALTTEESDPVPEGGRVMDTKHTGRWGIVFQSYPWPQCRYCGDARQQNLGDHPIAECLACGTRQCERQENAEFVCTGW